MSKVVIKFGDVFEIPLSDGRKAYGQYVYKNSNGLVIRVFNYLISKDEQFDINKINRSSLLFGPVYTGLYGAIENKIWKIVGNLPADDYIFEGFLSDMPILPEKKGDPVKISNWFLWDGNESLLLGSILPEKYKSYETTAIFPPNAIAERIETGFALFDYPKQHNRFLTREEVFEKFPKMKDFSEN